MSEREAFEDWFFASKYAQVVLPTEPDIHSAWDVWQAACKYQREKDADICIELQKEYEYALGIDMCTDAILNQGEKDD